MSESETERTLEPTHEIMEEDVGFRDLGLAGGRRRGVPLAQRP